VEPLEVVAAAPLLFLAELFLLEGVRSEPFVMGTPLAEPSLGLEAETVVLAAKTTKQAVVALVVTLAQAEEVVIEVTVLIRHRQGQVVVAEEDEAAGHQKPEAAEAAA
jgi:hypothetical protein